MRQVTGVVQHYAWGDPEAIPRLLGVAADGRPWAEWWVGTHPGGPAVLDDGTQLVEVSGQLPYLVKFLAAVEPLSLQTHPDGATARAGFRREVASGVTFDDPRRIYRDPHAKPEVICALTTFEALCGFRPVAVSLELLSVLGARSLHDHLARHGLERTVAALYRRELDLDEVVRACVAGAGPEAVTVADLARRYPDDPSVAVALLLHRVTLQPGEALFLGPGNLHAYLHGVGVEVMGASDNVVRGGLTPKYVDVEELLRVLSYEPMADPVVRPAATGDGRWRYATPRAPFVVERVEVSDRFVHTAIAREVAVCVTGEALGPRRAVYLAPGEQVEVAGPATVFLVGEDEAAAVA